MPRDKVAFDAIVSMLVALLGYYLLDSTGVIDHETVKISGGVVVYFANFWLMQKFRRQELPTKSSAAAEIQALKSRERYGDEIILGIDSAEKHIMMMFRSLNSSAEAAEVREEVAEIRNAIKRAVERQNGEIEIVVITGSNESYLRDGYELRNISERVHVHYCHQMRTSDLSAVLVDRRLLVLGIEKAPQESTSEETVERSRKWLSGESVTLCNVLCDHAENLRQSGDTYDSFLQSVSDRLMAEHNDNVGSVANLLRLPRQEVDRFSISGTSSAPGAT